MASTKRKKTNQRNIKGLKYFKVLTPLLKKLHLDGCERDKANNRKLHYDQYCMLVLLYLFNPVVSSLRAIQRASQLKHVQKKLGCPRTSLGSLSEATSVFDPELLAGVVEELSAKIPPIKNEITFKEVDQTMVLVDGTLLSALPKMAEAALLKQEKGKSEIKWRLHVQFEVKKGSPARIDLTDNSGSGEADERIVLEKSLKPEHCYVMDRGYAKFGLFNAIDRIKSSYVCRIHDHSHIKVLETRKLTEEEKTSGILTDEVVQLGNRSSGGSAKIDHGVRVITIKATPNPKRGGYAASAPTCDGYLRIATNLVDVPASIISLIYQYRWTIEIFFRFFKHILGCRHLLSYDENGIRIQIYCAIIACLLISLWIGRKPTLRTYEMICYYISGVADEEEMTEHIEKLKKH